VRGDGVARLMRRCLTIGYACESEVADVVDVEVNVVMAASTSRKRTRESR
jgi:hypothetical protein